MNILIFEYVNGGGFARAELPASFAREGWLMLKAVVSDLTANGEHTLSVLLDSRCMTKELPAGVTKITLTAEADVWAFFSAAVKNCDAVLPIAPESDGILQTLCSIVEALGKRLLCSPASAVANTADKLQTHKILVTHAIATIPSWPLETYRHFYPQGTIIKARDGVGCENCFICHTHDEFNHLLSRLDKPQHYLLQPFISGATLSISVLFNAGVGQLLCVNRQHLSQHGQQLKLNACEVNIPIEHAPFQALVEQLAQAFPALSGYVGVDLLQQHDGQLRVVEINPRLTSSYVGISEALGVNVIAQFIADKAVIPCKNKTVHIQLL